MKTERILLPSIAGLLACLTVATLMSIGACEYEPPTEPVEVVLVDSRGFPVHVTAYDMQVRVYSHSQGWSQWETIADSIGAEIPETDVLVMQFRQNGQVSSLAGFAWPELETCFIMPEHVEGNSVWRVTYGPSPDVWPGSGRIEFRENETHVTQASSRLMWYTAERWDGTAGAYVSQSPWFAVRWGHVDNPYHFDQPVGEETR